MPEPKRRFWQIHLSTAVVLMFVAGGWLWLSIKREHIFLGCGVAKSAKEIRFPLNAPPERIIERSDGFLEVRPPKMKGGSWRYVIGFPLRCYEYGYYDMEAGLADWSHFSFAALVLDLVSFTGAMLLSGAGLEYVVRRRTALFTKLTKNSQ